MEPCLATKRQEFLVAGYLTSTVNPRAIGTLVLALYDDFALSYVGRVDTGFTTKTAHELWKKLQPLRTDKQRVAERLRNPARKGVVWVEPQIVAEVEYRGWTSDGELRHASFKGIRNATTE